MIKNYHNNMTKMQDQNFFFLSINSLVCAANEFIFSNISDLIKSAVVFS